MFALSELSKTVLKIKRKAHGDKTKFKHDEYCALASWFRHDDRGKESQLQSVICLKGRVCIDVGLNRIQPLRKPIDPYMLRGQQ